MKKKLLFSLLILALVAVPLFAIACEEEVTPPGEEEEGPPGEEEEEPPAEEEGILKIGLSCPLTGSCAPHGFAFRHALELAMDDINAAGGVVVDGVRYKFTLIAYDDQYDPGMAADNVHRLVYEEGINYMMGPQGSAAALGVAPLTTAQEILSMSGWADPRMLEQEYAFRVQLAGQLRNSPFFNWIHAEYPDIENVAVIASNDATGRSDALAAINVVRDELGMEITDEVYYELGTSDFAPFATNLLAGNPDMIVYCGPDSIGQALCAKEVRALGYTGLMVTTIALAADDVVPVVGEEAVEGMISSIACALEAPYFSEELLSLPEKELAKYGETYAMTWDFYEHMFLLVEAINRTGSIDSTDLKLIFEDDTQVWPYVPIEGAELRFGSPASIAAFGARGLHSASFPFVFSQIIAGKNVNIAMVTP